GLPGRLGVGGAGPRRARPGLLHARVARTAAPPGRGGLRPPAVAGRAAVDVRAHAAGGPDPRLLPGAGRFAARPVGRRRPDALPGPALAGRRVAALVGPFRSVPGGADRTEGCEECEHCAMRRLLLSATAALLWLGVAAAPASAHSVSGVSATNFHTHLKSVTPAVPGLEVKVVEAGSRLQVTNHSGQEIVVLGYHDEPYLRIGPQGVFQNKLSTATYLNQTRKGKQPPASAQNAKPGETDWQQISSEPEARWHDHRIHWM